MKNLRGKRLLILGGTRWINAIADFAGENGVEVFAASNDPKAKFFEIAKESFLISSTDAEAMKKLIREKKIDGVHVGSHEVVLKSACKYLHESGLPCYCTEEQLNVLHNKENFKNACMSVGLPVVPRIEIDEDNLKGTSENLKYPVIVKPVDSSAARGVSLCKNVGEFLTACEEARNFSPTRKILVEKFMNNSGVYLHYTFSEGKAYFCGLSEKYPVQYKKHGSWVQGIHIFQSADIEHFRKCFEEKLLNLFDKLQMREGNIWFELFRDDEKYYFNECAYRYAGSQFMYPINYFYGINQVYSDLYYSLTGESCLRGHTSLIPDSVPKKSFYAIYPIHLKPGKISAVKGIDEFKKRENVVLIAEERFVGMNIEDSGTGRQIFATVHFVFDSRDELINMVNDIHEKIVVEDEHGENLSNKMLDMENVSADFFSRHRKEVK